MNRNPFFGDPVVPGRRRGKVVSVSGNLYRLEDDLGRFFRAEGTKQGGGSYRRGDWLLVLSGVVIGMTGKGALAAVHQV